MTVEFVSVWDLVFFAIAWHLSMWGMRAIAVGGLIKIVGSVAEQKKKELERKKEEWRKADGR